MPACPATDPQISHKQKLSPAQTAGHESVLQRWAFGARHCTQLRQRAAVWLAGWPAQGICESSSMGPNHSPHGPEAIARMTRLELEEIDRQNRGPALLACAQLNELQAEFVEINLRQVVRALTPMSSLLVASGWASTKGLPCRLNWSGRRPSGVRPSGMLQHRLPRPLLAMPRTCPPPRPSPAPSWTGYWLANAALDLRCVSRRPAENSLVWCLC